MVEVGLLAVGPEACALPWQVEVPVRRVRLHGITPDEGGLPELAREVGAALGPGPEADRWALLAEGLRGEQSAMLVAVSEVESADPAGLTEGWQAVLVVARLDEPALIPVVRALGGARPVTVLLGGRPRPEDPAARRNHAVLADLLRRRALAGLLHAADPERVVAVALDAARTPTVTELPRRKAVDLGPSLGLPPTWAIPASAVPTPRLVHLPLGQARALPELVGDLAAYEALREMLTGPPVDVAGGGVTDLDALRRGLDPAAVFEDLRVRALRALDTVAFAGDEPLVEAVARALRPLAAQVRELLAQTDAIEAARLASLRAFGAAGIDYTTQRLRSRLEEVTGERVAPSAAAVEALLEGELEAGEGGIDPLAWRHAFAGLPCHVVRRGQPGWRVARQLVQDQFAQFKAAFASTLARAVEARVVQATDPDAPLDPDAVRALHERAARVRDAVRAVHLELNGRILGGCEAALREDGVIRWLTASAGAARTPEGSAGERLRELLEDQLHRLAVGAELERAATVAFTRTPLGTSEPEAFERALDALVEAARTLPRTARALPTYPALLLALLGDREPEALRAHLASEGGVDPVLSIPPGTPADLLAWFERTGMRVEVRPGPPCAVAWTEADDLSDPDAEAGRCGAHEHRLADLLIPPPEGDAALGLVALVEAVVALILGLVVGELRATGTESRRAFWIAGPGLPPRAFLPHGAVHALASAQGARDTLASRIQGCLDALAASADAAESVQKLVELAELGPAPQVLTQIGLDHPRYKHLMPPIAAALRRAAQVAVVTLLDHMKADEVRVLAAPPPQRGVHDLLQLAPSRGLGEVPR